MADKPFNWSQYVTIKGYESYPDFASQLNQAMDVYACNSKHQDKILQAYKNHGNITITLPSYGVGSRPRIIDSTLYLSPLATQYGYRTKEGEIHRMDLVRLLTHEFEHFASRETHIDFTARNQTISPAEFAITANTDKDMAELCNVPPRKSYKNFMYVQPASGVKLKGDIVPNCSCDTTEAGALPSPNTPPTDGEPKRER